MNRFIAKTLGGLNALLFVFLAIILPVTYMSLPESQQDTGALSFGVIMVCVLTGLVVCGFVAFLARIADTLDQIRDRLKASDSDRKAAE